MVSGCSILPPTNTEVSSVAAVFEGGEDESGRYRENIL